MPLQSVCSQRRCAPALTIVVALLCPCADAEDLEDDDDHRGLPALNVSAGKGSQSRSSVNGAVVVVERAQLEQAQVVNTLDLARVLPGVQMSQSGSQLFPVIGLRGITSAQDFYNPALTVYVDGVPQLPVFAAQTLLNVERVELLKGPQGTLYGKSAEGGVLNIVSAVPDNTPALRVHSDISNRGGYQLRSDASVALQPDLLYGVVALSRISAPGALTNPLTGASDQGGVRSSSGAVRLRLAPAGALWQAELAAARDCASGSQDAYLPFGDIGQHNIYVASGLPLQYAQFGQRRCAGSSAVSLRYDWPRWRLTAMSAWQTVEIARHFPFGPYFTQQPERWRQNVQEIRLATPLSEPPQGPWDAVFGLYRQALQQTRSYFNTQVVPSVADVMTTSSDNHTQALSGYGDVTWHASAALDLSLGLRLARDQAWTSFNGSAGAATFADNATTSGQRLQGKLSAGYQLDRAWRAYANVAQGYKPGGFNLAPSSPADAQAYGAERAISYESGLRLRSQTLRASLAVYQVETRDTQLYSSNQVGYQSLHNVGDTRSKGLEFDLQWQAARRWVLGLNGLLNQADFTRYVDPYGCTDCAGKRVPFAPQWAMQLQLHGELPLADTLLLPQLALRWSGAQYFDTANNLRQGSYAVLDGALGWRVHERVEVTLYGQNLSNRVYRTFGFSGGALGNFAQPGAARTVGIKLAYEY